MTTLESAVRKARWKLIPFLALLYALNYLDRVNVGFAASTMQVDLGLSTAAFGLGAGLFFLGYSLFEVPSNIIMHKVGARLWIARIMVSWGLLACAMAWVQGETSFYVLRVLLGIAEAGLLPGIILYLTYWFPNEYRGRLTAQFFLALPLSLVVGAPLSTWIIGVGDGLFGLAGWQFMFVVEGLPAVLIGIAVFLFLPDRPQNAKWLTPAQKNALDKALASESREAADHGTASLRRALLDPKVYIMGLILFATVFGSYAFSFFMPQVIKDLQASFGAPLTDMQIALVTTIPFALAAVAMCVLSWSSDRKRERIWHAAVPLTLGAGAVALAAFAGSPIVAVILLAIAVSATMSATPILWQLPRYFLAGPAAAAGIGLVGAIANLSGFVAPTVTGALRQASGNFTSSLLTIAASMVVAVLLLIGLGRTRVFASRTGSVTTLTQIRPETNESPASPVETNVHAGATHTLREKEESTSTDTDSRK